MIKMIIKAKSSQMECVVGNLMNLLIILIYERKFLKLQLCSIETKIKNFVILFPLKTF